jgi:hypothetical protein
VSNQATHRCFALFRDGLQIRNAKAEALYYYRPATRDELKSLKKLKRKLRADSQFCPKLEAIIDSLFPLYRTERSNGETAFCA